MKIFSFIPILLIAGLAHASADKSISAVELNNQAAQEISKEVLPAAQDHLIQALGKSPENPALHLNLGFVFELNKQAEKAEASYLQALKFARNPEEKFAALYNLGELAQKGKKTDEALAYYQAALTENPDSRETKVNIELLIQQQQQQDQKKQGNQGQQQDQKNQQNGQNKDNKDNKDQEKDKNKSGEGDQDKEKQNDKQDQPKRYGHQAPPKPQFKSDQLNQGDVNKILGELKQQEQRIRAEYNRKEVKEKPNDKDW